MAGHQRFLGSATVLLSCTRLEKLGLETSGDRVSAVWGVSRCVGNPPDMCLSASPVLGLAVVSYSVCSLPLVYSRSPLNTRLPLKWNFFRLCILNVHVVLLSDVRALVIKYIFTV